MKDSDSKFNTRALHDYRNPQDQQGFVNTPIYRGSTIIFPTLNALEHAGKNKHTLNELVYGRRGNPTSYALEQTIAGLENGYAGLTVSSGLAAITTSLLAYLKTSDHLLMVDSVYGLTRDFCNHILEPLGVEVTYYDPCIGAEISKLIQPNTRCIFLESPGTSTFEVQDAPAIAKVARQHEIVTMMDNTWASPCFFRPLDHGINISITSATKYVVGHSDAMLGLIVTDEDNYSKVRIARDRIGPCAGPDDIYLGLRGIRTLAMRMKQHEQQAVKLAEWLKQQPDVMRVLHPAFSECPGHEIWKRDFSGSSGLFSFEIEKRSRKSIANFVDNMKLFSMGFSWGAFESLILPVDLGNTRIAGTNDIKGQLFRVYAGQEDIEDLIADLDTGLDRYRSGS